LSNLLISFVIGLGAAIVDVVPMIIKKLDRMFILSAFTMWIIVGILVPKIDFSRFPTINGLLSAILLFLPLSFLIYKMDKNAMFQVIITTIALGCIIGFLSGIFIK
jgi:hypothetical protein